MSRLIRAFSIVSLLAAGCNSGSVDIDETGEDPLVITTSNNGGANNGANNGGANNGVNNGANNGGENNGANNGSDCTDSDGDGWFTGCASYDDVQGPDCDDDDPNNWEACATCADADGDGWHGECDVYADGAQGPDCDDENVDAWMSCDTCADADQDGYWTGCDAFSAVEGPDCDDAVAATNPGATEIIGNGADDDCDFATLDTCDIPKVPAVDPEPGMLAGITAAHNYWRARVGTQPLTWNSALAVSATAYAEECIWQHDASRSPDAGFSYVGENLSANSRQPSNAVILDAVQAWADERFDYAYGATVGTPAPGVVGHYTQLVWDDSTEVGCGWARCQNPQGLNFSATIVVCRYGPGGNYTGETPYDYTAGACLDLDNDDKWQVEDPDDTDASK